MMTPEQHKAAAEKLANAVKENTNGAYDEWTSQGTQLNDRAKQAAFVRKHAGLSETPKEEDLKAIHQHVQTSLQDHVADIQAKNPGEHVVGSICMTGD